MELTIIHQVAFPETEWECFGEIVEFLVGRDVTRKQIVPKPFSVRPLTKNAAHQMMHVFVINIIVGVVILARER